MIRIASNSKIVTTTVSHTGNSSGTYFTVTHNFGTTNIRGVVRYASTTPKAILLW